MIVKACRDDEYDDGLYLTGSDEEEEAREDIAAKAVNLDVLCLRFTRCSFTHRMYPSRCSKHHVKKATEGRDHRFLQLILLILFHISTAVR